MAAEAGSAARVRVTGAAAAGGPARLLGLDGWRSVVGPFLAGLVVALLVVEPGALKLGLPVVALGALLALYALVVVKPEWGLLLILALYLFWFVPPPYAGAGTSAASANLAVLPALVVLIGRSWRTLGKLSRMDALMLALAGWYFVVLLVQAGGDVYLTGVAAKSLLWLLAWIPARALFRDPARLDQLAGAMVIGLVIVSALTVQEALTGWNYFEWSMPGLVDVTPMVRFGAKRYAGPFGHGVPTSIIVSMMLPFCFVWRRRLVGAGAALLGLAALYMCQARASWLGMILGAALVVAVAVRRREVSGRAILSALLGLAVLCVVFYPQVSFVARVLGGSFGDAPGTFGGYNVAELGGVLGDVPLGASFQRTRWWLPLIGALWHVPPLGYGPVQVATSYTSLAGALMNEWPAAVRGWFAFGPPYGTMLELVLLGGIWVLLRRCLRVDRVALGFALAALTAFVSQAVALHVNYVGDNWALPLAFVIVALGESAGQTVATTSAPGRSAMGRES